MAPKPTMAMPKPAPPRAMLAPEPEKPFAVLGAVLGDACPRKSDMLAAYASCRKGRIIGINLSIPAFDATAKARVFERAIVKYGAPDEDRRGGLPMRVKVMMPDWAATQTQPDLRPYRDKRAAFWWVDAVARHFMSVEETDTAVVIRVVLADPKARLDFDKQQAARDALEAAGSALSEKF